MKMAYAGTHPLVCAGYVLLLLFLTMITMNPCLVVLSFLTSFFYSCLAEQKFLGKRFMLSALPILFFSVFLMPVFYHNGVTPLFYINDMAVTLETVRYGVVMSLLLLAVIQWFQVWNIWIDSERFLYLFGSISPTLALLISMVLRFIPLLIRRFREIHDVQKGMGYTRERTSRMDRGRLLSKELSILVSWSLEHSMDTSISMEGRGYGIGKRSCFQLFRWKMRDTIMMAMEMALGIAVFVTIGTGAFETYFFPMFQMHAINTATRIGIGCYIALLALPLLLEGKEYACASIRNEKI